MKARLAPAVELSVVMPCLNEAETLGACIEKARTAIDELGIAAEIVVADNGSTDESRQIAIAAGARVVTVSAPGYGNALMGGIAASRGELIVMGDADNSYDFLELPRFVRKLREGNDLVQGCRLKRGGGKILPGAMPRLHRWGNPLLSWLLRTWFRAPVSDVYCGLRGFTREHYERLDLRCTGMEFATEMIIKSSLRPARIAEVPITLHPDGRSRKPHLRTFRDGWRTLRLYLLYCPRWLFMVPGVAMLYLGLLAYAVAMPSFRVFGVGFAAHTLLFGSLAIICGYQAITFAVFTRTFGAMEGLLPNNSHLKRLEDGFTIERGLVIAALMITAGVILLLLALNEWRVHDFGQLNYTTTMKMVVPGVTLTVLGFQTMLSSFFLSVLSLGRGSPASRGSLERKAEAARTSEILEAPVRVSERREEMTGAPARPR
ncbi:MAG TPA: glycosyltransferase family 2 protein [Solirubrobacterales bacterium]|nr:glycosyltransferase family 2 protein [Solirubrobacterales bacterium]